MAHLCSSKTTLHLLLLVTCFVDFSSGSRKLASLYQTPPTLLTYHRGPLLQGEIPISILWYGKFTRGEKSIISDFLLSLTPKTIQQTTAPSVNKWWSTIDTLVQKAGKTKTHIYISGLVSDDHCSIGKHLTRTQLSELALKAKPTKAGLVLVLTAADVAVDTFCMSSCGTHGSVSRLLPGLTYVWVGNSVTQCPGQCAWPFHQPVYGPQTKPLISPNGDVGADGMVINIAKLLAGAVTNPYGNGYFQGEMKAPVEIGSACPGVYGKGAYPGYAGELLVAERTGGSYNVVGVNGRKYLVPALFDPVTSVCSPVV